MAPRRLVDQFEFFPGEREQPCFWRTIGLREGVSWRFCCGHRSGGATASGRAQEKSMTVFAAASSKNALDEVDSRSSSRAG